MAKVPVLLLAALGLGHSLSCWGSTDRALLQEQISGIRSGDFSSLIRMWRTNPGPPSTPSLLGIAEDTQESAKARAIALMGAAALTHATPDSERVLTIAERLLRDRDWLVRLYAIKAMEACGTSGRAETLASRLSDPSLMVRAEAAEALYRLARVHPQQGTPPVIRELSRSLKSASNYVHGQAIWVPQRALAALAEFRAKSEIVGASQSQKGPVELRKQASQILKKWSDFSAPNEN